MKTTKKLTAMLLSVIMAFGVLTSVPLTASAAETDQTGSTADVESDISVESGSSVGSIIADAVSEEQESDEDDDIANKILNVEVSGTTATVEFNNDEACKIIVGIYDENGQEMYGSGMTEISEENAETATVSLEIDEMPQYFYIKAFILDENNKPLHTQYESDYYTQEFQDFLSKTVNDFEGQEVYNLDDDETNNFVVFSEDTASVELGDENVLTSYDESTETYVFTNVNSEITSLAAGDIFHFDYDDDMVVVKVASITVDGTTATITGEEDVDISEAFSYVKIDTSGTPGEDDVDMSDADEGVTYLGMEEDEDSSEVSSDKAGDGVSANADDSSVGKTGFDIEKSKSIKYSISKEFGSGNDKVVLSAAVKDKITAGLKVYLYWNKLTVDFSLTNKLSGEVKLSAELETEKIKLGSVKVPTGVGDVTIDVDVNFVIEAEVSISYSWNVKTVKGFKATLSVGSGLKTENTSKPDKTDTEIEFDGKIFVGIELNPEIEALGGIAKFGIKIEAGLEISGKTGGEIKTNAKEHHLCDTCIDGEVYAKGEFTVYFQLKVLGIKFKKEVTIASIKIHLFDFYYSSELGFGTGDCPNSEYRVKFTVVDKNDNPVEGATVDGLTTNAKGKATAYYKPGKHEITVTKDGYKDKTVKLKVKEAMSKAITLGVDTSDSEETVEETNYGGTVTASGSCGDDVAYTLYSDGTLVISGTGDMENYRSYSYAPWYDNRSLITSIMIENGVTSIGDYAFDDCDSLVDISIPDSVTSIGYEAFWDCDSLTSITIPDSVTSIGEEAFIACSSLTSITIPDSVTSIGEGAFYNCSNLASITIPDSVTSIGECVFYGCSSLTSITIPDSVASLDYMAFFGCDGLTSITIPDSVTSIGGYAFCNCDSLTSVTIPDSVTSVSDYAFGYCSSLTSITIGNGVMGIGNLAFYDCNSLASIEVASDNRSYSSVGGVLFSKDKTELVKYPEAKTDEIYIIPSSVTSIGDYAFDDCDGLTSITIPDSVTSIGHSAFGWCDSLTSITIPDSVTNLSDYAFYCCSSLTSITIPNSVTSIGDRAFYACESLTDVYYSGTEEQWNEISIDDYNDCLTDATKHYNSSGSSVGAKAELDEVGAAEPEEAAVEAQSTEAAEVKADETTETDSTVVSDTISKSGVVPGAEYVLMIIKGTAGSYTLSAENLLYIAQAAADENGTVEFTYYGDLSGETWVAVVCGECNHVLSDWLTLEEADYENTGVKVQMCTLCGEEVNREEIPALTPAETDPTETTATESSSSTKPTEATTATVPSSSTKPTEATTATVPTSATEPSKTNPTTPTEPTTKPTTEPATEPVETYILGDVNEDGVVDISDATAIQKAVAKITELTETQEKAAEVNGDGTIDISDATMIQKYVAKIISEFTAAK